MFDNKEKVVIGGKTFDYDVFEYLLNGFKEGFSYSSLTIEEAFRELHDLDYVIEMSKDKDSYNRFNEMSKDKQDEIIDVVKQIIIYFGLKYGVFNEKVDGSQKQINQLYDKYFNYFDEYVLYFLKFDCEGNFDKVATLNNLAFLFCNLPQRKVAYDKAYNMKKDNLDAFDYAITLKEVTIPEIIKINNIVNRSDIDKVEGFKKTNNDILGASFTPVDKKMVPEEMQKLIYEYNQGFGICILDPFEKGIAYNEKIERQYKIFEREAIFHIRFERIHPFNDGNGRTGRILMNYNLLHQGMAPVLITDFMSEDYKNCINNFDVEGFAKILANSHSLQMTTWISQAKANIYMDNSDMNNSFLARLEDYNSEEFYFDKKNTYTKVKK